MKEILVVDDSKQKIEKLSELIRKFDANRNLCKITAPELKYEREDNREKVIQFLDSLADINIFAVIFQDKNAGFYGPAFLDEYKRRGYKGSIIMFTASDWSWYKEDAKHDIERGFTDVFPWNTPEQEQLSFLRKYLS